MNDKSKELLLAKLHQIVMELANEYSAVVVNSHLSSLLDVVTQLHPNVKQYVDEVKEYTEAQCAAYRMAIDAIYGVINKAEAQS